MFIMWGYAHIDVPLAPNYELSLVKQGLPGRGEDAPLGPGGFYVGFWKSKSWIHKKFRV